MTEQQSTNAKFK